MISLSKKFAATALAFAMPVAIIASDVANAYGGSNSNSNTNHAASTSAADSFSESAASAVGNGGVVNNHITTGTGGGNNVNIQNRDRLQAPGVFMGGSGVSDCSVSVTLFGVGPGAGAGISPQWQSEWCHTLKAQRQNMNNATHLMASNDPAKVKKGEELYAISLAAMAKRDKNLAKTFDDWYQASQNPVFLDVLQTGSIVGIVSQMRNMPKQEKKPQPQP